MKKSAVLAILAAAAMMTGCTSAEQVFDKNYVRGFSVEGENGKAAVFSFYDENVEPYSSFAGDLSAVKKEAELGLGKTVFTGHTEIIVLGECDYASVLEFMLNDWKVSPSCLVVYGGPLSAYIMETYGAEKLTDSVNHIIKQGKAPECDIVTVLGGLLSDERSAEIPLIGESGFVGTEIISVK
ncbi:MAG: hypothetical protein IJX77_08605 [Ruminococcus sp.]|nr:hypothetical protein [Ruminococcus sp.]